nr:hypothetical protein pmam_295 [Pithovirus mammoth]
MYFRSWSRPNSMNKFWSFRINQNRNPRNQIAIFSLEFTRKLVTKLQFSHLSSLENW